MENRLLQYLNVQPDDVGCVNLYHTAEFNQKKHPRPGVKNAIAKWKESENVT